MRSFGLIGYPLGHSFSKKYFSEKFAREGILDARYDLFPLENIRELPALLAQNPTLCGLNVTIPYKETVLPLLDELDDTARVVGAVNCIKVLENQKLVGYNTDVVGFEKSLLAFEGWDKTSGSALILGTGGASKAVAYVLKKLGIPFKFVSRNPRSENEIGYEELTPHPSPPHPKPFPLNTKLSPLNTNHLPLNTPPLSLLVNTTPLGTFPKTEAMPPVPAEIFKSGLFVYDLIYNPAETLLLREAKSRGCLVKNGLEMLELQAEAAWEIWQKTP